MRWIESSFGIQCDTSISVVSFKVTPQTVDAIAAVVVSQTKYDELNICCRDGLHRAGCGQENNSECDWHTNYIDGHKHLSILMSILNFSSQSWRHQFPGYFALERYYDENRRWCTHNRSFIHSTKVHVQKFSIRMSLSLSYLFVFKLSAISLWSIVELVSLTNSWRTYLHIVVVIEE